MHIILSHAHCRERPYRSGYGRKRPSLRPEEYDHSAKIIASLAPMLRGMGHDVEVSEKEWHGQITEGKYNLAQKTAIDAMDPDAMAIEFHCDNGPPGMSGAKALVGNSVLAAAWAARWLKHYSSAIAIASRGVWSGEPRLRYYGKKYLLDHGPRHSVIIECGYASSATDSALLTDGNAAGAAIAAAHAATKEVLK